MKKSKIWFYSALVVFIVSLLLIVSGSSLMLIALDQAETIPLGTFITWFGMIALPLSIYWGVKEFRQPTRKITKYLSVSLKIILILGILWVPISYVLAGNLSFSFSEKETFKGGQDAMIWFWRLSYGIAIGAILNLIAYWFSLLFSRRKI